MLKKRTVEHVLRMSNEYSKKPYLRAYVQDSFVLLVRKG
jgi:hypothetical protein